MTPILMGAWAKPAGTASATAASAVRATRSVSQRFCIERPPVGRGGTVAVPPLDSPVVSCLALWCPVLPCGAASRGNHIRSRTRYTPDGLDPIHDHSRAPAAASGAGVCVARRACRGGRAPRRPPLPRPRGRQLLPAVPYLAAARGGRAGLPRHELPAARRRRRA